MKYHRNLFAVGDSNSNHWLGVHHLFDKLAIGCYFLQQTDFDGTSTLSEIKVVKINKLELDIIVFPNPTSEIINISFGESPQSSTLQEADYLIQLFDQSGKLVLQENRDIEETNVSIYTSGVPAGRYLLQVQSGRLTFTKQVILL